jgi:hypothetical protein
VVIDTPGGAIFTFVFPLALFAVVSLWLYLRRNAYPGPVPVRPPEPDPDPVEPASDEG